jgi:hypothetical protein
MKNNLKINLHRHTSGKRWRMLLLLIGALLAFTWSMAAAKPKSGKLKEYELKAAYIYNFIKFTDWPGEAIKDDKTPLIIGVFNEDQYIGLSNVLKNKKKEASLIKIVQLTAKDIKAGEKLPRCHVLFFPARLKKKQESLVGKQIQGQAILTIGERDKFVDDGGMVNFVIEKKKIRFEINLKAVDEAGLQIRAKLVRLAKRVIKKEESKESQDNED